MYFCEISGRVCYRFSLPNRIKGLAQSLMGMMIVLLKVMLTPEESSLPPAIVTDKAFNFWLGPAKTLFWVFVANAIFLGWLGAKPAEGTYTMMAQFGTLYYFGFFIVIMPLLGLFETPKRIPNSITEAVLEKKNGKA